MPDDAKEKVNTELNKFKLMPPMSAEASVVRGYRLDDKYSLEKEI